MKTALYILLVSSFKLFSQDQTIEINYTYDSPIGVTKEILQSELIHSQNQSIYILHDKNFDTKTTYLNENNEVTGEIIDEKVEIFKDFNTNRYYSKSPVPFTMKLTVKDSLNALKWDITNQRKLLLNYQCIEAKTTFHGRNYTAYYTEDIPISDGPWKFSGLPGMILELTEDTGILTIIAYEINITNNKIDFSTNLDIDNSFYWDDIIKMGKQKLKLCNIEIQKTNPLGSFNIDYRDALEIDNINE